MSEIHIDFTAYRGSFRVEVELTLPEDGVTAILGPSGSGKSSLLRAVAGLETPRRGQIEVAGATWFDSARRVNLRPQKRRVGLVFQDYALFEHFTVAGNVAHGLPRLNRQETVRQWLATLHIEDLAERYPRQLSGGQKQRVALARALATEPDMLLLDEPFSAVDQFLRQRLRSQLQGLVTGVRQPVLMVTHDLEEARQLADNVGVMVDGRLRRFGRTADVFADPGSYQVARVLGWRNLLPVSVIEERVARGSWGQLRIANSLPTDTAWIGIRPEYLRLGFGQPKDDAIQRLDARLVRCTDMGAIRELQCRLDDGTPIFLHRPWNEPVPAPGTHVGINIATGRLRALPESRVHRVTAGPIQLRSIREQVAPSAPPELASI